MGTEGGSKPSSDTNDYVTVGIRASDIILSTQDIQSSTARNRLLGNVTHVELVPPGYQITLNCGQDLQCQITGAALEELGIRPGMDLWAVFKASSCFLIQPPSQAELARL